MVIEYLKFPNEIFTWIFWIIIVIIIILIYLGVSAKYNVFEKLKFWKYVGIMVIAIIVLIILVYDIIEIYLITGVPYTSGMFWSLLNSLVLGMMLLCIGIFSAKGGNLINYLIIIVVVLLTLSGLGYLGVRFVLNVPLLVWIIYDSNGIYGIWFYSLNSYLFIGMVFISILFEKEKE